MLGREVTVQAPTPLPTGTLFAGRYRIEELLGRGGQGLVYRATHVELERSVAIKVLTSTSDGPSPRFRREALVQAQLRHRAIVQLLDYGMDAVERPYIVQEFVPGRSLETVIADARPGPDSFVPLMCDVLEALEAAHAVGVVHRDIKPSNIMVCPGPARFEARLLDFGVAKLFGDDGVTQLTRTGIIVGTPAYLSPEQVALEPIGPAADIYSLGVVLYELIVGERPFAGPVHAVLIARLGDDPPPVPASVPPPWATLLGIALARRPEERFPDARAMRRALVLASRGQMPTATPGLPRELEDPTAASDGRPRWPGVVALAVAVTGATAGLTATLLPSRTAEPRLTVRAPTPSADAAAPAGSRHDPTTAATVEDAGPDATPPETPRPDTGAPRVDAEAVTLPTPSPRPRPVTPGPPRPTVTPSPPVDETAPLERLIERDLAACRCGAADERIGRLVGLSPERARAHRKAYRLQCQLAIPDNCLTRGTTP